jgi:hypothetical protein
VQITDRPDPSPATAPAFLQAVFTSDFASATSDEQRSSPVVSEMTRKKRGRSIERVKQGIHFKTMIRA